MVGGISGIFKLRICINAIIQKFLSPFHENVSNVPLGRGS